MPRSSTLRVWMRASSGSRANARTVSALAIESATCPARMLEAASRSSTSRWRLRISGKMIASVAPISPSSTRISSGEYDHSTTAAKTSEMRFGRQGEAEDVEHVLEPLRVAERAFGERSGEIVVEERHVLREQLVHRLDVQRLHAADFHPRHQQEGQTPHDFTRQPEAGKSQDVRHQLAGGQRLVACKGAEHSRHHQRRRVEDESVSDA